MDESVGGAPAGVVDGKESMGLAGVAAGAFIVGIALWPVEAPVPVFPNSELPVLAKSPGAGAVVVGVVPWLLFCVPNRPPPLLGVEAPALLPNSPPAAAVVLAPPNKPPIAGVALAAVVVAGAPNNPPEVVGVAEEAPPPKRPPAGFCAALLCCPPKREPALLAGGVSLPPEEPPTVPKENFAGPEVAAAEPKRPPDAGAAVPVGLGAALEDPKLNVIAVENWFAFASVREMRDLWLTVT